MQRAFSIAQRVRAIVPKYNSQVTYASLHSSVVNAALADDIAKASANLKRKTYSAISQLYIYIYSCFQFQSLFRNQQKLINRVSLLFFPLYSRAWCCCCNRCFSRYRSLYRSCSRCCWMQGCCQLLSVQRCC
jgi:hypothetical protein